MKSALAVLLAIGLVFAVLSAQKPAAESPIVTATRKKLDRPITVDFKDTRLQDALQEIETQAEVKFRYETGVSRNTAITYAAKDKPLKDVLHEMFKDKMLGYVIHRKANANDRYEGYLDIVPGDQRGDDVTAAKKESAKTDTKAKAAGKAETKPDADDGDMQEKLAASRLKSAKTLLDNGNAADAREYCEQIIAKYPKTKAAAEAKELLKKIKK